MNPIQPIVWTNHEIDNLHHEIEYTNSHLLAIARNIENLSKIIDNTWVNLMFMAFFWSSGSWLISHIKMA